MGVAAVGKTSPITAAPPRPEPVIAHTAPGVLEGLGDDRLNSVLGKCLAMLDAIDRSRAKSLTGAELSRASGVPKASCHRLAARLVDYGMLDKADGRHSIGIPLFDLAPTVPP